MVSGAFILELVNDVRFRSVDVGMLRLETRLGFLVFLPGSEPVSSTYF